jgi:broad specificity phosphatase PhoE
MKILALRHLPTALNRQSVLQGRLDAAILTLDEEMQQQIQANLRFIAQHEPIDIVLTSSLRRTQQTCQAYGYDRFQTESLLDELDFGRYEGQPKALLEEELGVAWFSDPMSLVLGESLESLSQRVMRFLGKYASYPTVLIFAHGAWLRALLSIYECGTLTQMNKLVISNNSLHLIDYRVVPSTLTETDRELP